MVSVINGQDDSLLPASYSKGVMHMKHLLKFKTVRGSSSREARGQTANQTTEPEEGASLEGEISLAISVPKQDDKHL